MSENDAGLYRPQRKHRFVSIPLVILLIGAAAFAALKFTRAAPDRVDRPYRGPLVEAVDAPAGAARISVKGQGSVRPQEEIELVPQVSGVVVWKSEQLESGGYFRRGDQLAKIDRRDYELAVEAGQAELAKSEYDLEIARGEARVARQEWERVSEEVGEYDTAATEFGSRQVNPLVLHIPQLKAAEAAMRAARARRDEAQLRLDRTNLAAPFDGRVRSTNLDKGQYVVAGQPVARLYSIEGAEIVVPVSEAELAWLRLPQPAGSQLPDQRPAGARAHTVASPDSDQRVDLGDEVRRRSTAEGTGGLAPAVPEATVSGYYGGQLRQWEGRLVRAEGEFDERSRMLNLVVAVADPYASGSAPLTVGMFVDVAIRGPRVDGVRSLPRTALRAGDKVWTVAADGHLRVRKAQVVRKRGESIVVRLDMAPDERVVVSQLQGVTDGMKVRVEQGRLR